MDTFFSYRDGHNFGSSAYFCLIPYFLKLHNHDFGPDVAEMNVEVLLRPPIDREGRGNLFGPTKSEKIEPNFRYIKSVRKLKIEYSSRFFYLPQSLTSTSGVECQRFKDHYEEFKAVVVELGSKIETKCDFDCKELLDLMVKMADKLPSNDSELLELKEASVRHQVAMSQNKTAANAATYRSMSIPELITIHKHADDVGHYGDGCQFISGIYGEFALAGMLPLVEACTANTVATCCLLAVVLRFTPTGDYMEKEVSVIPRESNNWELDRQTAVDKLTAMLDSLPNVRYCSIAIRTFQVEIGSELFGLIDTSSEEHGDSLTLVPNNWYFEPPWDGNFQT